MPVVPISNIEQVTARFSSGLRQMARLTGFSPRDVLRAEAGSILKTWAGRTKVASADRIASRERLRVIRELGYTRAPERGDVTVNAGLRGPHGRVWIRSHTNSRKFVLGRSENFGAVGTKFGPKFRANLNDGEADVQATLRRRIPAAKRAAGLARQSVIQIADALRIDLTRVPGQGVSAAGIAKARAALASSGRAYRNGTGSQGGDDVRAYVQLFNTLPYNQRIGMDRTLLSVLAGRAAYFRRNYQEGVFKSLKDTARAYPGLFTVTN